MAGEANVSAKIKVADRDRAGALARRFEVNGMVIVRAWRLAFDGLGEDEQREAVARAMGLYPGGAARIGRGNRKVVAGSGSNSDQGWA